MCLSDYEIKLNTKTFKKKSNCNRLECFDYYKIGLINFHIGNYIEAYNNFKIAYNMKVKDQTRSTSYNNSSSLNGSPQNIRNKNITVNNFDNFIKKNINPSDNYANIAKWLAFTGMIILFSDYENGNKQNFKNICKIKLEDFEKEKNSTFLFNCCSARKTNKIGDFTNTINETNLKINSSKLNLF